MSVTVVDSFQSVHVKEQQRKLPAGPIAPPDFPVKHIHEVAIVGQPCQRIAGCLSAQVVLQLSLPGNVFGDDLVGFQLALFAEYFSSAEPDTSSSYGPSASIRFRWDRREHLHQFDPAIAPVCRSLE